MHPLRKMTLLGIPEKTDPGVAEMIRFMRPNRIQQKAGILKSSGGLPRGAQTLREKILPLEREEPLPPDARWAIPLPNKKLVCGHCGCISKPRRFLPTKQACVYTCYFCEKVNYALGVTFKKPKLAREFNTRTQCGHCGQFHKTRLYQLFGEDTIVFCPGCKQPGFILPFD
jgi:hypothetical protein